MDRYSAEADRLDVGYAYSSAMFYGRSSASSTPTSSSPDQIPSELEEILQCNLTPNKRAIIEALVSKWVSESAEQPSEAQEGDVRWGYAS